MTDLVPQRLEFPAFFDSTMLVTGRSCRQKLFRGYIEHLSSKAISPDLHAGGAFAAGIERTRRAYWEEGEDQDTAIALGIQALTKYWGDYNPPDNHVKQLDRMQGALDEYFEVYPFEGDVVTPYRYAEDNRPAVEYTFAIPIDVQHPDTGVPILFCGRFDLLGYYKDTMCIVDEKTTSRLGETWTQQWDLRSQFLGYCWALQQAGFRVNQAVVRGISILKTKYGHLECVVTYPDWQIERWYAQTCRDIRSFIENWKEGYWDYNYGEACSSYGGCEYKDLCLASKPENWLGSFERRMWNPLEKDPTWPEERKEAS